MFTALRSLQFYCTSLGLLPRIVHCGPEWGWCFLHPCLDCPLYLNSTTYYFSASSTLPLWLSSPAASSSAIITVLDIFLPKHLEISSTLLYPLQTSTSSFLLLCTVLNILYNKQSCMVSTLRKSAMDSVKRKSKAAQEHAAKSRVNAATAPEGYQSVYSQ